MDGSLTAKNGYKEEENVCEDLNTDMKLRFSMVSLLGHNYDTVQKIDGTSKVDVMSNDCSLKAQVKKYKKSQFGQLDRHWVSDFIKIHPTLCEIENMLTGLCEIPLLDNGTHVDKTKSRIPLSIENYSNEQLDNFICVLNANKMDILKYAFYGGDPSRMPNYVIGVEYIGTKRNKIIVYRIDDIINYLVNFNFEITKRKTVVSLANCISFQRKGGDSGKKGSNQLQIKFTISSLGIPPSIEHFF